MLEIVQAYENGEEVQFLNEDGEWETLLIPVFNFRDMKYRVKPGLIVYWIVYNNGRAMYSRQLGQLHKSYEEAFRVKQMYCNEEDNCRIVRLKEDENKTHE